MYTIAERMKPVAAAIADHLPRDRKVVVIPNMGNAGDSLINFAMYSLLQRQGIRFTAVEARDLVAIEQDATYVVLANGTLNNRENEMDRVIRLLIGAKVKIVLASATIENRAELLNALPDTAVVLAREAVTFEYVREVRPTLTIELSEDATMAIADGDADLPAPGLMRSLEYRLRVVRNALKRGHVAFALAPLRFQSAPNRVLHAMRTDNEMAPGQLPLLRNIDLSEVCGGNQDIGSAEAGAYMFLKIVQSKKLVRTNRLHVAIACCLMGVPCVFSANSYFKCRAIYEHSLARRFPSITWEQGAAGVNAR